MAHLLSAATGLPRAHISITGNKRKLVLLWVVRKHNNGFVEGFACDNLQFPSSCELGYNNLVLFT